MITIDPKIIRYMQSMDQDQRQKFLAKLLILTCQKYDLADQLHLDDSRKKIIDIQSKLDKLYQAIQETDGLTNRQIKFKAGFENLVNLYKLDDKTWIHIQTLKQKSDFINGLIREEERALLKLNSEGGD